jgi:hypothetical protein
VWLVYLVVVLAVMFAPVLFARRPAPPAEEDTDDNGGGGPRRRSPDSPKPPLAGLPLPDADQSLTRVRDHRREGSGARARRRPLPGRHRRTPSRVG